MKFSDIALVFYIIKSTDVDLAILLLVVLFCRSLKAGGLRDDFAIILLKFPAIIGWRSKIRQPLIVRESEVRNSNAAAARSSIGSPVSYYCVIRK